MRCAVHAYDVCVVLIVRSIVVTLRSKLNSDKVAEYKNKEKLMLTAGFQVYFIFFYYLFKYTLKMLGYIEKNAADCVCVYLNDIAIALHFMLKIHTIFTNCVT